MKNIDKSSTFNEQLELKIETLKGPHDSEVSYCPARGGIPTSIKIYGIEILYLNKDNFKDLDKNVRGGIPILFPNTGPVDQEKYPGLKQHGLARTSSKWQAEKNEEENLFTEKLSSDDETKKIFPYDFLLQISGKIEEDGSITLKQGVDNLEKDKSLPTSMGLHPYFKVPRELKKDIKFNFKGGEIIEKDFKNWSNDGTTVIDNPGLYNPSAVVEIFIPELGTLTLDISSEYKKIQIWSLPDSDFICIEPVFRQEGDFINNPEMVKPGDSAQGKINIKLG